MNSSLGEILASKLTAKKKSKAIADALLGGTLEAAAILDASRNLPDAELAILMESLEGATCKRPELVNDALWSLLIECLGHEAPRVQSVRRRSSTGAFR